MFEKEIINAINELSSKIEILNSSLNCSGNFWDKYSIGVIGLFGVIVGALITYFFNKKINQEERITRFATQRKNLVYAPIYKELLQLTQYIKKHKDCHINIMTEEDSNKEDFNKIENCYYYDGGTYERGHFIIWNEMKDDIRKDYVSQRIQEYLEKINESWKIYEKYRDKINIDFKKLCEKYNIGKLYAEVDDPMHANILPLSNTPAFLFLKDGNYMDGLKKIYKDYKYFSRNEYADFKNELEKLFKNLTVEINRNDFFESYEKLVKSIIEAKKEINRLMKYIINKYEFGEKLEKYE